MSSEKLTQPTIDQDFDFCRQALQRLGDEVGSLSGQGSYPEWWPSGDYHAARRRIAEQIKENPDYAHLVVDYYALSLEERAHNQQILPPEQQKYTEPYTVGTMANQLGVDTVGRAVAMEGPGGVLRTGLFAALDRSTEVKCIPTTEIQVAKVAYQVDSCVDLLSVDDELPRHLLHYQPMRSMCHLDEQRAGIGEFSREQQREFTHAWMAKAVELTTDMPADEAADYTYSASHKSFINERPELDVISKINTFGADRIRRLTKFCGIRGLDCYTAQQLERMEALADASPEYIEALSRHDVTAVFVNRLGDYCGVLSKTAHDVDDANERTVFFEIATAGDMYRHMSTLHRLGIAPSTLVVASHSSAGRFLVCSDVRGEARKDVMTVDSAASVAVQQQNPDLLPGVTLYSIEEARGLRRMIDEYMRPSRAIDDDPSDSGRKKIVLLGCRLAEKVPSADVDIYGDTVLRDDQSVISQLGNSLAADVQRNVDIYGGAQSMQFHASEHGLLFSTLPLVANTPHGRTHLPATRIRVEQGHVSEQMVDEVVLRKPSSK